MERLHEFIHQQTEDVGTVVVAHDIEVVPGAREVIELDIGEEDALGVVQRPAR